MATRTPLHDEHLKLGAKMLEFAGWEMPIQYRGVTEEHLTVRNKAGLFDVSHMGTFDISGPDTVNFLNYLTPSDNRQLGDGQAQYSLLLTDKGTLVDDLILYRIKENHFLAVVNAGNIEKDYQWIKSHLKGDVTLKNVSNDYTLMAIQGPLAAKILGKVTDVDLSTVEPFHLSMGNIHDAGEAIFARTGYTGEDGFEIFADPKHAVQVWQKLMAAGEEYGIQPIGLGARDTLRLEMKYCLYGHEISDETNALEAGLRWVIKFKKDDDFIGKSALQGIRKEGLTRKLVGFQMIDKGIPRHGYTIQADGKPIGTVTSGTFSPSLKTPIGIGYVSTPHSDIGAKISIDIRGKERLAEVIKTPFYKQTV